MPTVYSGEFGQVLLGDASGTLQDVGVYCKSITYNYAHDDTDLTTFASGGGPVTEYHAHGAVVSDATLKCLYHPALLKIIRQVVAARSGTTLQVKAGSNAAPTQGDDIFAGTFTVFDDTITYNTGAAATMDIHLQISDSGAITPAIGTI